MTTFTGNNVSSGEIIYAADHNTLIALLAAVINGNIDATNLATDAVTTTKIADSNVTTAKIADSAVTTAKINDDAVTPAKWTNPYCFRAERASGTTTLPDNTATQLTGFDTEVYDYNNNYASDTYTAPVAGVYNFCGAFQITTGVASGVTLNAMIYVNGSQALSGSVTTSTTGNMGASVSGDILLAASDTVTLYAQQDSAGSENAGGGGARCYFAGHLVHAT